MADKALIDGKVISLGGDQYVVPALSLGQVKRLMVDIEVVSGEGATQEKVVGAAIKIVTAALSRNYPDMTEAQVEDKLDLSNFRSVIDAVMGVSGLTQSGEVSGATGR